MITQTQERGMHSTPSLSNLVRQAATSTSTSLQTAKLYHEAGICTIPCWNKKPLIPWHDFRYEMPTWDMVRGWYRRWQRPQLAVVCGVVSGNLAVLDVDSLEKCAEVESAHPFLKDTFTVRSGSGRGRHYYVVADALPPTTICEGIELRSNGAYVIAAPSIHTQAGQPYWVERDADLSHLPDVESLRAWIESRQISAAPIPRPAALISVVRSSNFGMKALDAECSAVAAATEGSANARLNRAAFKLGQLVAGGHLNRGEVETALEQAATALTNRDGLRATQRTIASGLNAGEKNPRR